MLLFLTELYALLTPVANAKLLAYWYTTDETSFKFIYNQILSKTCYSSFPQNWSLKKFWMPRQMGGSYAHGKRCMGLRTVYI